MSPTEIKVSTNSPGCILTYRLDHAISSKGMGISLPKLPQPGATTTAVLKETERGWLLIFAMLLAGLNLSVGSRTAIWSIGFGAAAAFGYGLLGDLSDHLAGFWGTAALVLAPLFLLLGWLVTRLVSGTEGKLLALQVPLYGVLYPSLAGVDAERQTLYLNLCALTLLAITAWLAARRLGNIPPPLNEELSAQSLPS